MPSAADALNVARSYLGVAESPPHSNRTIIGEKFGWNGVAWCAETVSVVEGEAGVSFDGSASCSVLVGRYESGENGTWLGNPGDTSQLQPGDEFFLGPGGGDHTGLVESLLFDQVHTIEGNWGDRVCRVTRPISAFFGFGRPNYDGAAAPDLPPPSQTAGRAVLRQGNTGQAVTDVQNWLNVFANAGLAADGDFGPATDAAVRAFQSAQQIDADGEVGPQTYAAMDRVVAWCAAQAAPAPPAEAPAFPGTTRLGSHGAAVTAVQQRLADRQWSIGVDGVFGRQTDSIVRQYQSQKGLAVDGVVGPNTWVSLWTAPIT